MSIYAAAPTGNRSLTAKPLVRRPPGTKYRTVLSVDGGGVRGVIPTMVLLKVEDLIKEHVFEHRDDLIPESMRHAVKTVDDFDIDLTDYFDMVAGTSIGSLIATYIANRGKGSDGLLSEPNVIDRYDQLRPGSIEVLRALFEEYGRDVFPQNILSNIRRFFMAKYPASGLENTLKLILGDTTMDDLETGLLVTSYDAERDSACSFLRGFESNQSTYTVRTAVRLVPRLPAPYAQARLAETEQEPGVLRHPGWEEGVRTIDWDPATGQLQWEPDIEILPDTNYYLRDITMASASAPTFFPPSRITPLTSNDELTLLDGGVVANNPILQALTYTSSTSQLGTIRDAAILSLGCGSVHVRHDVRNNPGLLWWLTSGELLGAPQSGTSEYIQGSIDYWIYRNLELRLGQYMRIQKAADTPELRDLLTPLDNIQDLPRLEEVGEQLAEDNEEALKVFVRDFIFAK